MTEDKILDNFEAFDPRAIQESFEYQMLLTVFWLIWSAWSFYEGTVMLGIIREDAPGLYSSFPYSIGIVYDYCFIGILTLGMAIVIFKQSENRISYLFSFVGITLISLLVENVIVGGAFTFLGAIIICFPMLIVLFVKNLKVCLICYAFSLLLFAFLGYTLSYRTEYLFIRPRFILFYILIFMSAYSYKTRFFPLKEVVIKLRYRGLFLLGFLPLVITYFF